MRPISLKTLSGALFITLCAATTAFAATTEADSLSAALSRARTPAEREQTYVRLADLCADSTALAALYWEAALTEAAGAGDDYGCREALDRLVQGFSAKQPERALEYVRLADSLLPDRRFALFRASLNAFWLWKQMSVANSFEAIDRAQAEFRERHSFCFRFQPVDKRALNSIALDAQAEGIPLWDRDISRYVYSNRVPVYNPLEDFLFNLPEWDGRDRIRPLAQTVPCDNPHWPELFHRWFLNMVAHWRGMDKRYANSVSPLLVGAQGTRKSTFCRSIMPPSECSYYTDSLDFSRKKDVELSLNRFALINIDEFDQVSATQQGFLKHILQKPVVNARRPYGTSVVEMRRYASFIATSNHKDLLTDPSGSRRFICIEVKGVIDTSRPIDYDQLYAQAMHELAHGERYWFNDADEYVMTEANREFQQYSPEEQFLFRYFRMAEAGEEGEWMAPAEILKILHQEVDIPLNAKRVAAFGRILRKQGIPSRHTRKGTVYQLVRA